MFLIWRFLKVTSCQTFIKEWILSIYFSFFFFFFGSKGKIFLKV